MLVNRVTALLRALAVVLCIAAPALLPGGPLALHGSVASAPPLAGQLAPSIGVDQERLPSDLRAAPRVELVVAEQRVIARLQAALLGDSALCLRTDAASLDDHHGWCDVVQCRRLSGVHLLGYATPPPTRAVITAANQIAA